MERVFDFRPSIREIFGFFIKGPRGRSVVIFFKEETNLLRLESFVANKIMLEETRENNTTNQNGEKEAEHRKSWNLSHNS